MSVDGTDRLRGARDICAQKTIPGTQELRQEDYFLFPFVFGFFFF